LFHLFFFLFKLFSLPHSLSFGLFLSGSPLSFLFFDLPPLLLPKLGGQLSLARFFLLPVGLGLSFVFFSDVLELSFVAKELLELTLLLLLDSLKSLLLFLEEGTIGDGC
jgi:hypothetical protein